MHADAPSRTAYRVAMHRAAHQLFDHPRIFDDPLAVSIAGLDDASELRAERGRLQTPTARHLRAFMAVRSRYAEDQLSHAIGHGVRQYVVLGAGLDTYAYRRPEAVDGLRVFEVDHPATQAWKRDRLAHGRIPIPGSLTFVPVDFEHQTLAAALVAAGFRTDQPAFFAWLGVVMYLTLEAATSTLAFIGSLPTESGVTFDYAISRNALTWMERMAADALAARVARAGEPFRLFFEPAELAQMLANLGFGRLEDLGTAELNARYFHERTDGLRIGGGLARLMTARR